MQITVCLQLYNTASINQSSVRDPSMLFTHVHVKELQNQSGLCLVWQCLPRTGCAVSQFFDARIAEGSLAVGMNPIMIHRFHRSLYLQ